MAVAAKKKKKICSARQLVRQDGGRAANFRVRNRCNYPDVRTNWRAPTKVQPRAVQADQTVTTSGSNGHLIDQAVHTLVEERLFKKKGH